MDRWRAYSGVDFERRVHAYFGMNSTISAGAISTRDDSFDASELEDHLNEELRTWWMRVAETSPDRIARFHNFTYPSAAEFVALAPGRHAAGASQMAPPLPVPWLDLRHLHDRTYAHGDTIIQRVPFDEMYRIGGLRWAYWADGLYFATSLSRRGPSRDYSLRLDYVPQPEPIDIDADAVRSDIPLELHEVIALGCALRLAAQKRQTVEPTLLVRLDQMYAGVSATALKSVTRSVNAADYMNYTQRALIEERGLYADI